MKRLLIIGALILVIGLIALMVSSSVGVQDLGERTIIGKVASVEMAYTMPKKVAVTLDDGTYLILGRYTVVDAQSVYRVKVKETKRWWGTYSDVIEFTPINPSEEVK